MATAPGDPILELLRRDPQLVLDALRHRCLGLGSTPAVEGLLDIGSLWPGPIVVARGSGGARRALAVALRSGPDRHLGASWIATRPTLQARANCPPRLVLLVPTRRTADDFARELPSAELIGPRQIPRVRSSKLARRRPELAVLAAVMHGRHDPEVARVAWLACAELPDDRVARYTALIVDHLPAHRHPQLVDALRQLAEPGPPSAWRRDSGGYQAGRREGLDLGLGLAADALLDILTLRAMFLAPVDRDRIRACRSPCELARWLHRARSVDSRAQLFADDWDGQDDQDDQGRH